MIDFVQDKCSNYQHRTFLNIELSELTIIFAIDLTTAGEKLTIKYCDICEKPKFIFQINKNGRIDSSQSQLITDLINYINKNNVKIINIAGNGIYRFKQYGITQQRLNELVYNILNYILASTYSVEKIRTGGQTGSDEAGLVAGDKLGLETVSFCPKGWRFRNINNEDIYSEEQYKARFNTQE